MLKTIYNRKNGIILVAVLAIFAGLFVFPSVANTEMKSESAAAGVIRSIYAPAVEDSAPVAIAERTEEILVTTSRNLTTQRISTRTRAGFVLRYYVLLLAAVLFIFIFLNWRTVSEYLKYYHFKGIIISYIQAQDGSL
ncbi:MAG: hypothetical protein IJ608_05760 [Lachnospiraceae bacterium]|nr:hypothetical protein [Lachnospiraceae bacterium]